MPWGLGGEMHYSGYYNYEKATVFFQKKSFSRKQQSRRDEAEPVFTAIKERKKQKVREEAHVKCVGYHPMSQLEDAQAGAWLCWRSVSR